MRRRTFLAMWAVLVAIAGVVVVVQDRLDQGGAASDQVIASPNGTVGTTTSTTGIVVVVPGPGQVRVAGTVTALRLGGAVLAPRQLATPLTIVSSRGFGNGGELTNVVVDGKPSTIVWDGGRPFALSGTGRMVLGPTEVLLAPDGLRLALGSTPIPLEQGTYRLDTPVAVGTSGIATPRDSVVFQATTSSLFEPHGDASLGLGPDGPRRFVGPGRVEVQGTLELTDASGTRTATRFSLDEAAFDLTLNPESTGGWTIAGLTDVRAPPDQRAP